MERKPLHELRVWMVELSDLSEKGVKEISASLQEVFADVFARAVCVAKRTAERQLRSGPIAWPVCRCSLSGEALALAQRDNNLPFPVGHFHVLLR